jgi:hypothetical protein
MEMRIDQPWHDNAVVRIHDVDGNAEPFRGVDVDGSNPRDRAVQGED